MRIPFPHRFGGWQQAVSKPIEQRVCCDNLDSHSLSNRVMKPVLYFYASKAGAVPGGIVGKKKQKGLVIVESPAKARKIGEYLGRDYTVLASVGHIRDLPAKAAEIPPEFKKEPWATLGVNVTAQFEPLYVVPTEKKKIIKELKDAMKDVDELILATDEDREGESIGWHLAKVLNPKIPVKRMVFSEITKEAIQTALKNSRQLDENLVSAQETRRVLDRLYGYTLSPLLWKKIARGLSAGRVQSVAVRMLVQRELERLAFHSGKYWDLKAQLQTAGQAEFQAVLTSVDKQRVATGKDFDENTGKLKPNADVRLLDETEARDLLDSIKGGPWTVSQVESRQQTRSPYAPFTTSTLQQEANRKLGMTARATMQTAQRLYEDGYITYMRTDSVHLSTEAITAARSCVQTRYGDEYLSSEPRQYTTTSKGAQEAHEAIRPAGTEMKTAEELGLSDQQAKLYALIWKRTIATQMAEAKLTFQTVTIASGNAEFRATGRHVDFPGFFRAYVEGVDDADAVLDDQDSTLPPLEESATLNCKELEPVFHETKPPARFTEASLVRKLEAEGVGRPSTYATVIGTIQDRGYVRKANNQLIPTYTAMAVTRLLENYFPRLVDYKFTADMEQELDDIATGSRDRLPYLQRFYAGKEGLEEQVKANEENIDPRAACTLNFEGISANIRVGRYGPYLERKDNGEDVTASIPEDVAPADITNDKVEQLIHDKKQGPQSLGMHPEEGLPIYILRGPFGPYLQLGEVVEGEAKPKRVGIPKNMDPNSLPLETALALINLPRDLGQHPETGKKVTAGVGRFGPYVLHDKVYKSLGKDDNVLIVDLNQAVELLKQARTKQAAAPLRELGNHPEDGDPIGLYEGKYGPYVKHKKILATVPKDTPLETVTLEQALTWIAEKAAKGGGKRGKKSAGRKSPTKTAARKTKAGGTKKKAKKSKSGKSDDE